MPTTVPRAARKTRVLVSGRTPLAATIEPVAIVSVPEEIAPAVSLVSADGQVSGPAWFAQILAEHDAQPAATLTLLASDPHAEPAILTAIAAASFELGWFNTSLFLELVQNPATPLDIVEQIVFQPTCQDLQVSAAQRHDLTPELGHRLLRAQPKPGWKYDSQMALAVNDYCPPDVLRTLVDSASSVRTQTALNPNTPIDVLERLFHQGDNDVPFAEPCEGLLANPSLPEHLLAQVRDTDDDLARNDLVDNPKIGADWIRHELAHEDNDIWIVRCLQNPSCPQDIREQYRHDSRWWIGLALHPDCPSDWLEQFAQEADISALNIIIAEHPNASSATLQRIAARDMADRDGPSFARELTNCTRLSYSYASLVYQRRDLPEEFLLSQPVARLAAAGAHAGTCRSLSITQVECARALAGTWPGTLGELLDAAILLGR